MNSPESKTILRALRIARANPAARPVLLPLIRMAYSLRTNKKFASMTNEADFKKFWNSSKQSKYEDKIWFVTQKNDEAKLKKVLTDLASEAFTAGLDSYSTPSDRD